MLLHEMAHIARRDHWVGIAERAAAVLFWWNPLVHRMCDGISELREQICDTYVVLVQGDGQRLARLLVELAARAADRPLLPSTVGVLEPQLAGLTGRVSRLLDKEQNMDIRMSFRSRMVVFACGLAVVTGMASVGALRLAGAQAGTEKKPAGSDRPAATAQAGPAATPSPSAANLPKSAARPSSNCFEFQGRVLDPAGKPLPGAKIYFVFYTNYTHPPLPPPKVRATAGPDGEFHFAMEKSEFDAWRSSHPWGIFDDVNYRNDCRLVAQADCYGPVWKPAFAFDPSGELRSRIIQTHPRDAEAASKKIEPVLRLVKDDVPLLGRTVDPKGRPIAGVKIAVRYVQPAENEDLTAWLAVVAQKDADLVRTMKSMSQAYLPGGSFIDSFISSEVLPQIAPTATSDADGRFRLTGMGRERLVSLLIQGPTIESAWVGSRTRPGPTFVMPYHRPWSLTKFTFYGANFEHVARPSVAIIGTVRDKDTGKPLPGAKIQAHKLAGHPVPGHLASIYIHTTADKQGRYRLIGMPIGKDNELLAVPVQGQPYLLSRQRVDTSAAQGAGSVQADFPLKRGVWVRGRATDAKTGEPVPYCAIDYYAFLNNPFDVTLNQANVFDLAGTFDKAMHEPAPAQ